MSFIKKAINGISNLEKASVGQHSKIQPPLPMNVIKIYMQEGLGHVKKK